MTQEELDKLKVIAYDHEGWKTRTRLQEYLKTVKVVSVEEAPKDPATSLVAPPRRTGDQNAALHLWFKQIADTCRDAGIDSQLLFSKVIDLEVNEDAIKTLWHAIQKAYYKTNSTTELTKTKQMDKIIDTMIRFFAERHELELPPFPNDLHKNNIRLTQINESRAVPYPDDYKLPSF